MTGARRFWFLIFVGLGGAAILTTLGVWQLGRLEEKRARIVALERQMAAPPVAVTGDERAETHNFRAATAEGAFDAAGRTIRYLMTIRPHGPGFRLIDAFTLANGRRILVDRGYAPEAAPRRDRARRRAPLAARALILDAGAQPRERHLVRAERGEPRGGARRRAGAPRALRGADPPRRALAGALAGDG